MYSSDNPLAGSFPSLSMAEHLEFELVGEGAANVVFEVQVQSSGDSGLEGATTLERAVSETPAYTKNLGNLLRLPKAGSLAHGYGELLEYWTTAVRPLFTPTDLVHHQLVRLEDEATILRLNGVLAREDPIRRADFRGSRVASVGIGMLVEDMRGKPPNRLTLEFKPKWLTQSPSAPASAVRCRNCAREALKRHTKPHKAGSQHKILCPLDLLRCRTSQTSLSNVLAHFSALDPSLTPQTHQYTRLAHWLQTNTLLPRLRNAQQAADTAGPLGISTDDDTQVAQFQLAMTLRDCTCFVRIPANPDTPVEAKLADLDKKNAAAKLGYWREMESKLIESGYYEGSEVPRQGTDCVLERALGLGEDQ